MRTPPQPHEVAAWIAALDHFLYDGGRRDTHAAEDRARPTDATTPKPISTGDPVNQSFSYIRVYMYINKIKPFQMLYSNTIKI